MPNSFTGLASPAHFLFEEKRSRFLTYLYPITTKKDCAHYLVELKEQYPDARHYCTAYVIGNPEQANEAGFNDDGEPRGTAGKPMLNVLMQRRIGNVYAVVVRYFGGIKLGAGGLTRAYSAAVSGAVDNAIVTEVRPTTALAIAIPFALEERVRDTLKKHNITHISVQYTHIATLTVTCEQRKAIELTTSIINITAGQALITKIN